MINTLINTLQKWPTNAKTLCDSLNNPEMAQVMIPAIDSRAPYQRMYNKTKKKNTLLILAIIVLIILTLILNLSVFTTNAECIVSSDYSSLIYNQNVYLALDYGDFEAKHYKTIAKNVTVNGEKTFEHLLCVDNLEAVDDSPINEMLYLQTDYDYNFPNGNPDRFYVEKSVYSKYQSILEDFQPTTYFIYKDKYDTTLPWEEFDSDFFLNITSCAEKTENAKSISDWFTKGGTENSYFICGYQKPFYKDLGEIKKIDGEYYYLPYEHTNISKYTTGETTQTFYKIDNDYTERLGKLIGKISE